MRKRNVLCVLLMCMVLLGSLTTTASVDFGLIAPDGLFYPVPGQNGGIHKTIEIDKRGNYTFAIRNNSNVEISVSGCVNY